MTTNQEGKHSSARTIASSSGVYPEDLIAMADAEGFTTGTINERLLQWANARTGGSSNTLIEALNLMAINEGFNNWNDLNTLTVEASLTTSDGDNITTNDGTIIEWQ